MRPSALENSLKAALRSREDRRIRRRLPDPLTEPSIDFNSNDYLSLTTSPHLRQHFLSKLHASPHILGSGGSRLLVNGQAHATLEDRLRRFFRGPALVDDNNDNNNTDTDTDTVALLFNSGYDANVGVFSCLPQKGDVVVYDEYIHASVHDGIRASHAGRAAAFAFAHNSLAGLEALLDRLVLERKGLRDGTGSVFVAVESLYSMDGTFAPLLEIDRMLEKTFPGGNAWLIVDEAHATGIYGPLGRGRVAELGLEKRCLVRLVTFGKALGASGAVVITNTLVRDYLLNYARSLIYTTSLSYASIIAVDASFDLLENGTASQLSQKLLDLSAYLTSLLLPLLASHQIPASILSLPPHLGITTPAAGSPSPPTTTTTTATTATTATPPSPILPLLTSSPRELSAHLHALGMNARPITWPTVPRGKDRVRVCLHAGNTRAEVRALVEGCVAWARTMRMGAEEEEEESRNEDVRTGGGGGGGGMVHLQSKL